MYGVTKRRWEWTLEKYSSIMKECLLNNKALIIDTNDIFTVHFIIPIKNCDDINLQADSLLHQFESEKQYKLYNDPSRDCVISRLFDDNIFVELNEGELFASYNFKKPH